MNSSNSIQNKLTESELEFLEHHKIGLHDLFDSRQFKSADAKRIAKEHGCSFLLGTECNAHGHRLRTRSGHCIQCDPKKIRFKQRHYEPGFVYLAGSKQLKLFKVGCSISPSDRQLQINKQNYAGTSDWKMVFWCKVKHMGKIEQGALSRLSTFAVEATYMKDGIKLQACYEIVRCKLGTALDAIQKEVGQSNDFQYIKEYRDYNWSEVS